MIVKLGRGETTEPTWLLVLNVAKCSLFVINCVLQCERGYRRSSSSYVFAKTCRRHLFFLSEFD